MSVVVDREAAFLEAIRHVADDVAGPNADEVDQLARFPAEAIGALREVRALSALVPTALGGEGLPLGVVARACFELGRRCGATAMVYAMHQIQVATVVRHADGAEWFEDYLRDVAADQRLIASATSEVGTGGDMGKSIACVDDAGDGISSFEKHAPTVSYGMHADDLCTTLRRHPDAEPGDQVVVFTRGDEHTLEQRGSWDPLGMRGTCSPGFLVRASFPSAAVLAVPFSRVASESMVPISHILWAHLWLGIATDAFDRARSFVRVLARQRPGQPVPAAARLSHVMSELSMLRAEVAMALQEFTVASDTDREQLSTMASRLRFNNLKVAASEQTPRICQGALNVAGIVGYKNDTPYSIGRHLRDSMSASLMVANERIHETNASLLLIAKEV